MKQTLEEFIKRIPSFDELEDGSSGILIEYFIYFLTEVYPEGVASYRTISECYDSLGIREYSNIPGYIRKKVNERKIKDNNSKFSLFRKRKKDISELLVGDPIEQKVAKKLRDYLSLVNDENEKLFLEEVIRCYEVNALRSAIVMIWSLSIYHLQVYILTNHQAQFNSVLRRRPENHLQNLTIRNRDD